MDSNIKEMRYRKKPVVIEAIQYTGKNLTDIQNFTHDNISYSVENGRVKLTIPTLEGELNVSENDYVIRGVKGEYYPCKPDIFEGTYEEAAEDIRMADYPYSRCADKELGRGAFIAEVRKNRRLCIGHEGSFGQAIESLKQGKKVARKGWNGKGMWLWLKFGTQVKAEWCHDDALKAIAEKNGGSIEALGTICMKTADNKILSGWLASQTDMLSEDWVIVE